MYRTEPPTDKTIREWYMKFQQSGCLCAAKRRGKTKQTLLKVSYDFHIPGNGLYTMLVSTLKDSKTSKHVLFCISCK